jgi:hypothetical protein
MRCEICKTEKRIKARTDYKLEHLIKVSGWDCGTTKAYHDYCPKCKGLIAQANLFNS